MNRFMCHIWTFKTRNYAVHVDALYDDAPEGALEGMSDEDADALAAKLESGELTLFCARARLLWQGKEIASDYLGSCIYADIEEFRDHIECAKQTRKLREEGGAGTIGSYFAQMVRTVLNEGRAEMKEMAQAANALRNKRAAAA